MLWQLLIHWGYLMVVMTAKLSKKKLIAALLVVAALAALLVLCLRDSGGETRNDDRLAFLSSFGYSVKGDPVQVQQVKIPSEPSEVFERYNALQRSQGYDLSRLAGRNVTRYVYELEDGEGTWYATVLEHRGQIVGGDVASPDPGGTMHGFRQ